MSLDVTKPADVADLFVETCRRLRALGATRVEGIGWCASFGPAPAAPINHQAPSEPEIQLSPAARALQERARQLAEGEQP